MLHRLLLSTFLSTVLLYASPLFEAIKANDPKQVEVLLKKGADPYEYISSYPYHIMCYAAAFSDSNMLKTLLTYSSNVDKVCPTVQITPLMSASAYSNIDNMELLLQKGANINAKQIGSFEPNVLLYAISAKQSESAIWLIDHGANINYSGTYGNNAIAIAIANNDVNLLKKLIKKGINLNGKNAFDALDTASITLKYDFVKILVDNGVNPNYSDDEGNSILHLLASGKIEKNIANMQNYVDHPQQGRVFSKEHYNSVQQSINELKSRWNNYDKIVHYLVDHGANKNLKNKAGKTPLQIAIEQKNQKVIDILK